MIAGQIELGSRGTHKLSRHLEKIGAMVCFWCFQNFKTIISRVGKLITIEMNYWLAISLVFITVRAFIINSFVEQFWIDEISISILALFSQLLINHRLQIRGHVQLVFQTLRNVFRYDFVGVLRNNWLRIDILGVKFKFKGVSWLALVKKEVFWV